MCAAAGWQTLVFLDAGGGAAGAPPASVHMTPLAMPWTGELAATHAIETLLDAARVGRAVQVTGRLRDMALATDPVLKLLTAHAIMAPQAVLAGPPGQGAEAGPSQDVVAVLAAQLDDLLPGHPDVSALRAATSWKRTPANSGVVTVRTKPSTRIGNAASIVFKRIHILPRWQQLDQ